MSRVCEKGIANQVHRRDQYKQEVIRDMELMERFGASPEALDEMRFRYDLICWQEEHNDTRIPTRVVREEFMRSKEEENGN